MDQLFIWLLIIVAIISFWKYIEHIIQTKEKTLAYKKRDYLMTKAEIEFFHVLESIVRDQYYIVPQLPISKIALTVARGKDYYMYSNKIDRKTVDFVLFNKESFSPVMVIELDDSSHDNEKRRTRDNFVDDLMKNIGLKIVHIKTAYTYNPEEITNLIFGTENNKNKEN
jgi:hypothetical protein